MSAEYGNLWIGFAALAVTVVSAVVAMVWWARGNTSDIQHLEQRVDKHEQTTDNRFVRHSDVIRELNDKVVQIEKQNAVREAIDGVEKPSVPYKPHKTGDA